MRKHVVNELLASERRYCDRLDELHSAFVEPLATAAAALLAAGEPERVTLTKEAHATIFSNVGTIRDLTSKFLSQLELALSEADYDPARACIGSVFVRFCPFFKAAYAEYASTYDGAASLAAELLTDRGGEDDAPERQQRFRQFCANVAAARLCGDNSLQSLLIMPVQRVPRYRLLIQELLKHTMSSHADVAPLKRALHVISKVAASINASARTKEEKMRIYERFQCFARLPPSFAPYEEGRRIVREATLQKVDRRGHRRPRFFVLLVDRDAQLRSLLGSTVQFATRSNASEGDGGVAAVTDAAATAASRTGASTGVWLVYGHRIANSNRLIYRGAVDVVDVIDINAEAAGSSAIRRIRALSKPDPAQLSLSETPVPPRSFVLRGTKRSFVLVAPTVEEKMAWLLAVHEAVQTRRRGVEEIRRMTLTDLSSRATAASAVAEVERSEGAVTAATGAVEGAVARGSLEEEEGSESSRSAAVAWQPDRGADACTQCATKFWILVRRHHCRACGCVVCNSCSLHRRVVPQADTFASAAMRGVVRPSGLQRVCDTCVASMPDADSVSSIAATVEGRPDANDTLDASDAFRRRVLRKKLEDRIITAAEYAHIMRSVDTITSAAVTEEGAIAVDAAATPRVCCDAPEGGAASDAAVADALSLKDAARAAIVVATMAALAGRALADGAERAASVVAPSVATWAAVERADMAAVFATAAASSCAAGAASAVTALLRVPFSRAPAVEASAAATVEKAEATNPPVVADESPMRVGASLERLRALTALIAAATAELGALAETRGAEDDISLAHIESLLREAQATAAAAVEMRHAEVVEVAEMRGWHRVIMREWAASGEWGRRAGHWSSGARGNGGGVGGAPSASVPLEPNGVADTDAARVLRFRKLRHLDDGRALRAMLLEEDTGVREIVDCTLRALFFGAVSSGRVKERGEAPVASKAELIRMVRFRAKGSALSENMLAQMRLVQVLFAAASDDASSINVSGFVHGMRSAIADEQQNDVVAWIFDEIGRVLPGVEPQEREQAGGGSCSAEFTATSLGVAFSAPPTAMQTRGRLEDADAAAESSGEDGPVLEGNGAAAFASIVARFDLMMEESRVS